jgi:hypothetical protein
VDAGGPAPPNDCGPVTPVASTTAVPVTFYFNTGTTTPPTETGGPITGSWKVTGATLYLPSGLQGVANLQQSTGTVNAWGVFTAGTFDIDAVVNLSIASLLGPQPLDETFDYQGTSTTSGATFNITATCGDAGPPPFTATYTSNGTTGTIDLAIPGEGGTSDMVLTATITP